MNILMISDVYHPRVNGVSTSIATFRKSLHAAGHETTLLAPAYSHKKAEAEDRIVRVPSRYLPFDPEDRIMRSDALLAEARNLAGQGFDIIHIHTPFIAHRAGTRLARELDIPVVETYHTYFEEYLHHYLPVLPRTWLRLLVRTASRRLENHLHGLIVPSSAIAQALRSYGVKIPIQIIPTGLDLNEFRPGVRQNFCKLYDIDPQRPSLVYVGRVAHEKNIAFLLDVVLRIRAEIPDILLIIAGEGPAKNALFDQARNQDLVKNVKFVGYLERGQPLWDCYSAGDVFVFASNTETQGLVLLEAMALGLPVVSTAQLGTRDVLTNCSGALIAAGNVDDFAAKTLDVLRDPLLRQTLARHARSMALRWSSEKITETLVSYYNTIVQGMPIQKSAVPEAGSQPVD